MSAACFLKVASKSFKLVREVISNAFHYKIFTVVTKAIIRVDHGIIISKPSKFRLSESIVGFFSHCFVIESNT